MNINSIKIGVLGIGYVGLPLSLSFAKKYELVAYDSNQTRIEELKKNIDSNLEFSKKKFIKIKKNIVFTNKKNDLKNCNIYIITVPTPINRNKKPDLKFLKIANNIVGKFLNKNDIVVYESTVYPGLTEEFCIPYLEKYSKLKCKINNNLQKKNNNYFYCGYSPERINPGDKKHTFENIPKIVSGSTKSTASFLKKLYSSVIKAKVYKTDSIKIAEAAKIIENTQRDLNIALINEFSLIFNKMKIDTNSILKAASTKWNFLNFKPGLVGGHCISVDPYYLTYQSQKLGYNPKLILAGRSINDDMGKYIANIAKSKLNKNKKNKILIMGLSFKENCSDLRNSQVYNIFEILRKKNKIDLYDPLVPNSEVKKKYRTNKINILRKKYYNLIIIAVSHDHFKKIGIKKISSLLNVRSSRMIIDVKGAFPNKYSFFKL